MEYNEMAKYYDIFYRNKSYDKEILFIKELIKDKKTILDVGCGTGIHMSLLEKEGYIVDGLDLSKDMLEIAKSRTKGKLHKQNLINCKLDKKYDVIISMFAVFNHLKNYHEFEKGIINCYEMLNDNGILIIDLHNGKTDGEKENISDNYKRRMKWRYDNTNHKEYTEIEYTINNKKYYDNHEFIIYEIDKIKEVLNNNNLKYKLYENYTTTPATENSKNIEIIIYKNML